MSDVWFTSDLHLQHNRLADLRGFGGDTELHNRAVMTNIYDTVRNGDQLWILGDISSGSNGSESHALALLSKLRKDRRLSLHLVAGNHDTVHPAHRTAQKRYRAFNEVFDTVQPFARRRIAGRNVWLSHFPWRGYGDRNPGVERYAECRLNNTTPGDWLLHGHTHFAEPVSSANSINVGVDAWDLAPVSIHEITDMILTGNDMPFVAEPEEEYSI